jgi:hypothetical protein
MYFKGYHIIDALFLSNLLFIRLDLDVSICHYSFPGDETPVSALPSNVCSLQQHESSHPADARQDGRHTQVRQLPHLQQSCTGMKAR